MITSFASLLFLVRIQHLYRTVFTLQSGKLCVELSAIYGGLGRKLVGNRMSNVPINFVFDKVLITVSNYVNRYNQTFLCNKSDNPIICVTVG